MRRPFVVKELASGNAFMRYDASVITQPHVGLFDPGHAALDARPVSEGGRQAAWYVRCGSHDAVLRHYRRGGLAAKVSSRHYVFMGLSHARSLNEFDVLRMLYEAGLPVPRPLAAIVWKHGLTYRAALIVERLHEVSALASCLDVADSEQVARAIYAMHEQGVWHADLNAYNILLDNEGRAWLIDFDKARRMVLSLERRSANLLRLRRSLAKVAGAQGITWWDDLNRHYTRLTRAVGM